jgi:hypothetical protein
MNGFWTSAACWIWTGGTALLGTACLAAAVAAFALAAKRKRPAFSLGAAFLLLGRGNAGNHRNMMIFCRRATNTPNGL